MDRREVEIGMGTLVHYFWVCSNTFESTCPAWSKILGEVEPSLYWLWKDTIFLSPNWNSDTCVWGLRQSINHLLAVVKFTVLQMEEMSSENSMKPRTRWSHYYVITENRYSCVISFCNMICTTTILRCHRRWVNHSKLSSICILFVDIHFHVPNLTDAAWIWTDSSFQCPT